MKIFTNTSTKIFVLLLGICLFFIPKTYVEASTLDCWDVDGVSIFGYDTSDDVYIFIGAISNEFGSDSIANEFGAGNEFSSDSIFNEFGDFGSEFSSESAFNEFASKPPILIDDDNEFVGYLTLNEYKTPNINPYHALNCAKDSFTSSNSDHEDYVFPYIPKKKSSPGYSQSDIEELLKKTCPVNSTYTNGSCSCNSGYLVNSSGDACITITESCQNSYGVNVYGLGTSCYCKDGFEWNNSKTACIKKELPPVLEKIQKEDAQEKNVLKCESGFFKDSNGECQPEIKTITSNNQIKVKEKTCSTGQALSLDKTYCVTIPKNSHVVESDTDVWLCDEGFEEKNNRCIEKTEKVEVIEEINMSVAETANDPNTRNQENATDGDNFFVRIFVSIKNWFVNLFN